ncbi:uncharacterized protein Dere_GG27271 [Drosophila erecta]|uniref:Single domain-containing protein n=1 Tax=Drosophila erecta TaxID=7220 RepID=A0A0Q5VSF8_DROER|nr:uncharacterized protein Dere_GG27271 [Drosophila erecta]
MKFIFFCMVALILVASMESMIFVKILHSDKYPGQCYPIHVRVGKKKKYDVFALQPGEEVSDPNTCGVQVCMTAAGLTYVYYCPRTLPSSGCQDDEAMDTLLKFPECCWTCATSKDCDESESFPSYPYPPIMRDHQLA